MFLKIYILRLSWGCSALRNTAYCTTQCALHKPLHIWWVTGVLHAYRKDKDICNTCDTKLYAQRQHYTDILQKKKLVCPSAFTLTSTKRSKTGDELIFFSWGISIVWLRHQFFNEFFTLCVWFLFSVHQRWAEGEFLFVLLCSIGASWPVNHPMNFQSDSAGPGQYIEVSGWCRNYS